MDRFRARRQDEPESGFTLIELLVVIIIIGILAAVALPIFMNQRTKAYDGVAKSDLRNLAQFQEAYLVAHDSYATIASILADNDGLRVSENVTISVERFDGGVGYCLSSVYAGSPNIWYFDSQGGGQQPLGSSGCPVTTTGTAGDSVTG